MLLINKCQCDNFIVPIHMGLLMINSVFNTLLLRTFEMVVKLLELYLRSAQPIIIRVKKCNYNK